MSKKLLFNKNNGLSLIFKYIPSSPSLYNPIFNEGNGEYECDYIINNANYPTQVSYYSKEDFYRFRTPQGARHIKYLKITNNVTDMSYMFPICVPPYDSDNVYENSSLLTVNTTNWDTSSVTNMEGMFYRCTTLTSVDVSKFDTSSVTNMEGMFYHCEALSSLDLSNWDVSNVTDMSGMFYSCSELSSLDINSWDVSNVTDMSSMFVGCYGLSSLDLSNWDVSNVADMSNMFYICNLTSLDLSNWNIRNNGVNMRSMFYSCALLTSLDLSGWDFSNVSMLDTFDGCRALNYINLSNANLGDYSIFSEIPDRNSTTTGTIVLTKGFNDSELLSLLSSKNWEVIYS